MKSEVTSPHKFSLEWMRKVVVCLNVKCTIHTKAWISFKWRFWDNHKVCVGEISTDGEFFKVMTIYLQNLNSKL